ncbi:unnamed protein product [Rotaria sordida]|uniref:PWWP domain-containing protein n=1 Tax=Rotaria sordida TaxID=392033 RepID=A0A813NYI4_9BILA|nr:unnamed protein product [Rotaria sordida]CAF0822817.1 unnamed protein product [Rotaria sordida]CAF3634486.1 unnamed protein product [Rotaria sordida]CAF3798546.1 unnamed protein product [Rotaria sordida]
MTSVTQHSETMANTLVGDASADMHMTNSEENLVNGMDEESNANENKIGKRKRSTKKSLEPTENIPNGRPKRTLSKREEVSTNMVNGTTKTNKTKIEQTNGEADDDQERDKQIPILYDVADVVWVKMGGHPWWPSLVIRDPNDSTGCFTKISGNARPKRMYFVVFYGSTADFAWVSDAAIIPYKGVEAFTKYAQETVDKAQTKSQKEQLTERFQLKVTIGRREDWEMAVREADEAIKQTNEKRLQEIEPKVHFYTKRLVTPKGQPGRRPKTSITKPEESSESIGTSTLDPNNRSLLAEKTFEFKSDDEDSSTDSPIRKSSSVKIKLSKQTSNDSDSNPTPPNKNRYIPKTISSADKINTTATTTTTTTTVFGQTANGSSVSYEQRTPINTNSVNTTPIKTNPTQIVNGTSSGRKRGRPRLKQPSISSSNEDVPVPEFNSASPSVTTKFTTQRKPIIKPQAFMNSSTNNVLSGQHDIRTGFLSPFEEQEVLDALEQLGSTKTFEEAEQKAKRRFEHILCLNLNRTHVDIPQEWFYTFLFTHPSLIIKNPQWFTEKNNTDTLNDNDLLNDVQSSSSLAVLKHQLVVLSKLYRNELQARQSAPVKKRRSTAGSNVGKQKSIEKKQDLDEKLNDIQDKEQQQQQEELIN